MRPVYHTLSQETTLFFAISVDVQVCSTLVGCRPPLGELVDGLETPLNSPLA